MARPLLEVADIFRGHGAAWRHANRGHVSLGQLKVMSAIESCRTAALGGHVARCENDACGHTTIAYNSCLMGKFRNGELAVGRIGLIVDFIDFRSPLRTALGLDAQPVRSQKGPLRGSGGAMGSMGSKPRHMLILVGSRVRSTKWPSEYLV
jgi:Transposase zinc-binding domain